MQNFRLPVLMTGILAVVLLITGCGGGSGDSTSNAVAVVTTDMTGTLTIPTSVNNLLLTGIRSGQNTDSDVRNAFASATVFVNDVAASNRVITPSSVSSNWDIQILGVPQASDGKYRIHLTAGRLALKSWVKAADKNSFSMNSRTTAAALLAEKAKLDANALLASFPAMVSKVTMQVESAYNASSTEVTGTIFNLPVLQTEVTTQADFLAKNTDFDPTAKVAYLGTSNDLDGNGVADLKVSQTVDRTGIRFETTISNLTTMKVNIAKLAEYSDAALLSDFSSGNTRTDRTFDATAQNLGLGLYFSRGAGGDQYLKLLIKRIDMVAGSLSGVVAEYSFVTATGTAIATGTKIIFLKGSKNALTGAVEGTNFTTDSVATTGYLVYLDADRGLGANDGTTRIVRAIDGQPDLPKLSSAETYVEGGSTYAAHTGNALKAINKTRALQAGDVFSAYFKTTRNYALFKIKTVSAEAVTVDYVVNSALDEPRF